MGKIRGIFRAVRAVVELDGVIALFRRYWWAVVAALGAVWAFLMQSVGPAGSIVLAISATVLTWGVFFVEVPNWKQKRAAAKKRVGLSLADNKLLYPTGGNVPVAEMVRVRVSNYSDDPVRLEARGSWIPLARPDGERWDACWEPRVGVAPSAWREVGPVDPQHVCLVAIERIAGQRTLDPRSQIDRSDDAFRCRLCNARFPVNKLQNAKRHVVHFHPNDLQVPFSAIEDSSALCGVKPSELDDYQYYPKAAEIDMEYQVRLTVICPDQTTESIVVGFRKNRTDAWVAYEVSP